MIRVGVIGALGRMGSETCRAIEEDPDLELVARVGRGDSLDALRDGRAEVVVDFTTPSAVKDNVLACLERGLDCVVGTTGLTAADLEEISKIARERAAGVLVAPNFALGAVLMMRFAAQAAPYFGRAEIVERHHAHKLDAPSGTARRTAEMMGAAQADDRLETPPEPMQPSRGEEVSGIRIHSLRVPGSVAHQEVILGGQGETLTIRHDSMDRSSFMPGVLLAVKKVSTLDGVVVGLEHLIDSE